MVRQLDPLQSDATSGDGRVLIVPDPERMVSFLIRCKGTPAGGEITFECCPMNIAIGIMWRALKTVPVPTDISTVTGYYAGSVSGMFRARISTPIMGDATATVWPLVGVLIGNANAALEPVVR